MDAPSPKDLLSASQQGGTTLRGKTAVVTGSTSGIGLGIAQALAAERRRRGVERVRRRGRDRRLARASPRKCIAYASSYSAADMSKPDEIDEHDSQAATPISAASTSSSTTPASSNGAGRRVPAGALGRDHRHQSVAAFHASGPCCRR